MTSETGPYLIMAAICDKVLQEQDGVLSAIRIIDRLTRVAAGEEATDEMQPFDHFLSALIMFRAGEARGRYKVKLRPEDPSGVQMPAVEMPVHFQGEEQGANLVLNFPFRFEMEGLYWFDVFFQDERVTRIPLRVIYQPQPGVRAG